MASDADLDRLSINTIRTLAMDAVQAANSGHPGTPMALAPVAYALWQRRLRFDPDDPIWPNRDRFVLSAGHASMLLYALLHLTGVKAVNADYERLGEPSVTLDDVRCFRQLESRCPGHPEYRWTSGVETTTGPLGQGVATSVGMAIGGRWLAARYNRPGFDVFDYDVYALAGDGCMMEGVSSEAASLAAHLRLSNLCWIYDNNRITIEGSTSLAFSEDVATRFVGYGWNVTRVGDANDLDMLDRAFETFRNTHDRPTLIIVDSHIGYGAPTKQDTSAAHGEPLGEDEIRKTKRFYGWPEDAKFLVPDEVRRHFREGIGARGRAAREAWMAAFNAYRQQYPELAEQLERIQARRLPDGWDARLPVFPADPKGIAGREASAAVLNAVAAGVPWLVGGSADLTPSTKTRITVEGAGDLTAATPGGRNVHFGVREHAMAAVLNGLSLTKLRPYGSGFLIFSDYARPAIRLSALMELPVIHIFTHDSIGVGEDGPTHQPVEQLAALRAVPGLITLRPADANEVVEAWRAIMALGHQPAALILSRQALPTLDRGTYAPASGLARGGYVLADAADGTPDVLLIATGSEVALAVAAYEQLSAEGIRARVVSMPSWELFEQQSAEYRASVLPPDVAARVSVEQASVLGWERYVGLSGRAVGMRTFGSSAPLKDLQKKFGFTPSEVVAAAKAQLAASRGQMTQPRTNGTSPLLEVIEQGQSLWYDSIRRSLITSGELRRLIDADGLRGVTSNPAIFEKAISGSRDYDDLLDQKDQAGADAKSIYERLAIRDIQDAADVLKPVYERTGRRDGYVSLEVSPVLAHDAQASINEGRRLWKAVGRPNAMIKIPATAEGIPAIRTLISEGINVNVTLLFSQTAYERVAEAYLAGLEARASAAGDLAPVASVASFFVSRIDTLVDARLQERAAAAATEAERQRILALTGHVAIANAKLVYEKYLAAYSGKRWEALAAAGARTQRLLWASTSAKDPAYRDVYYVEELIGPDTVNTVPPATFDAFRDHGQVRQSLTADLDRARDTMATLEAVGISMQDVTDTLLVDAVRLFAEPFEKLLAAIESRRSDGTRTRDRRDR